MTPKLPESNRPETGNVAVLNLAAGPRKIPDSEARQMQSAIADFLANHWTDVTTAVPANLISYFPRSAGDPMVDDALNLRLGSWLVEASGNEVTATYRPLPPGNFRFTLALAQPKGRWEVSGVSWDKIMPRR